MEPGRKRQSMREDMMTESSTEEEQIDVGKLKDDWKNYKALFIPLNKVFEWNPPHFPAIVIGVVTFLFALLWYIESSVLTTLSVFVIFVVCIDAALPLISNHLYNTDNWSGELDKQYEHVCIRLSHAKKHIINMWTSLMSLKREKHTVFLMIVLSVLLTTAWIGSLIDNLLLVYLIALFTILVPGLRKHGILQQFTSRLPTIIKAKDKTH